MPVWVTMRRTSCCTTGTEKITPRMLRFETGSVNPQATPSAKGVTAIKMKGDKLAGASG